MDWKDTVKGLAKAAKDTAEAVTATVASEVWPVLQPQLLILAARLEEDVRSGAVQANAQVQAFLKIHAAPTAAQVLRDDDTFDFLAELAYDSLPRPVRRRVKLGQVVAFCRKQREKLLAALEGEDAPPKTPTQRALKALPPPSDG